MIAGQSVLGVIPARGGSKGVPRKNLRSVGGKPLLAWTIEAAARSRYLDRVVVSSDDAEIRAAAKALGAEALERPAELARDDTPGIDPVLHALSALPGFDWVVLLQPTSPLRSTEDIDGTLRRCLDRGADACVSVSPARETPYWMYTLGSSERLERLLPSAALPDRRQDAPPVYVLNGAVYAARTGWLSRSKTFLADATVGYPMPHERSVDIDTEQDLQLVDLMLQRNS
ncbi:MAG TPA: acylneuraminate cytidylyltransferase family protein [Burkholderiales bacterium]|nr:acylneuraminate cytidylyltransferase family protein [Burkholderiales bacterium]